MDTDIYSHPNVIDVKIYKTLFQSAARNYYVWLQSYHCIDVINIFLQNLIVPRNGEWETEQWTNVFGKLKDNQHKSITSIRRKAQFLVKLVLLFVKIFVCTRQRYKIGFDYAKQTGPSLWIQQPHKVSLFYNCHIFFLYRSPPFSKMSYFDGSFAMRARSVTPRSGEYSSYSPSFGDSGGNQLGQSLGHMKPVFNSAR